MYPAVSTVLPKEKLIHQSPPSCKALCKWMQHCWPTFPNIVKCHILCLFAHPVACCCMSLGVVVQSLKLVKRLSQQLPTFLLFCDHQSAVTTMLYPFAQLFSIVSATHARYQCIVFKVLWVVSFPWCTAGLNIVTQDYQHGQISVGSCCVRLHIV